MSERYYRVYDSRGTVEVTMTKTRAEQFKSTGYPVEVWDLKQTPTSSIHDAKQVLYGLDGGSGPGGLSRGRGVKVGDLEEVAQ
ncbi:hypothetical protein HCTV-16_gp9 [Haloarcula virus HCTV-16]|nr:hypothetical protein HCTV-16_gp9 [Haloarcula virus HCTV-16]